MCAHFTAQRMVELSRQREIFGYEQGGAVVGTVSWVGNEVFTMFVDPLWAAGGRRPVADVTHRGAGHGGGVTIIWRPGASITTHDFYRRLGYADVHESQTEFGLN